jgi:hypothetical protein
MRHFGVMSSHRLCGVPSMERAKVVPVLKLTVYASLLADEDASTSL